MKTSDVFEQLQAGIQLHQSGDLEQAETIYRSILEEFPDHPDALHLLGVIALQIGEYETAEQLIEMAINFNLQVADYHNNLGEVYLATGRVEDAAKQYALALEIDPQHQNARKNLDKILNEYPTQPAEEAGDVVTRELLPQVRQALPSYIFSLDDEAYNANQKLVEISLTAGLRAAELDLSPLAQRFPQETADLINVWPGEHFRFLAGLVNVLQPQLVIEIGTATGASALAMKSVLPAGARIVSYDTVPWNEYPGSGLQAGDMDNQLEQRFADLSDDAQAQEEKTLLQQADLILVHAAGDYARDKKICALFDSIAFEKNPIMVFDDIRTMNMLKIWREIAHPKLDITSYGHWSGTGLVDWTS